MFLRFHDFYQLNCIRLGYLHLADPFPLRLGLGLEDMSNNNCVAISSTTRTRTLLRMLYRDI